MAKNDLFATETLHDERERLGLTQQEMADVLSVKLKKNISLGLYQKIEYRNRGVTTEDALAIAKELGISFKHLWEVQ